MKKFKMNEKEDPDIITTVKIKPLGEDDIKTNPMEAKFTEAKSAEDEAPRISLFKLFTYSTKLDTFLITLALLSSLATGALAPIQLEIFGSLTSDMVSFGEQLGQVTNETSEEKIEEIKQGLLDAVTNFAIYNSYIGVAMLALSYTAVALMNFSAIRQTFTIRGLFFKKTLNQDISWYDLHQTGDFSSRLSEDLHKLEEGIGEKIPMFVHHQVSFIGCLILAFIRGWQLALVCLISFPLTMIAMLIVSRITSALSKKELDVYGVAGAIAEEVLSSIKTVVAFGGQDKEMQRYSFHLVNACEISKKRGFFGGLGFGLLWFFIYASYSLAFWYGVKLIIKEDSNYDAGTMMTVFFGVMMGSMNFGMSSPFIESFSVACGAGAKVFSVINRQPEIDSSSTEGKKIDNVKGSITFTDVHFQYPSRSDVKILRGLNLSINRGETVALVGSSGCGKSTCIQLIQRFYDPSSGSVKLDGVDIKDLNVSWLRSQIGVVGQEPVLFGTTVGENIRHGNPQASQLDIENAARKANAHDFIMSLPQGYDTLVGERGAQMSGGQKQRIAIARALVREPPILLLDEATSALDTNSEAKVQKALDNASEGRTTIIVAHRLSTIRGANKIVVVSQGSVVEQGTHSELMTLKSHYYNLVTTQMSNDGDDELDEQEQDAVRGFMRTVSVIRSDSTLSDKRDSYIPEQITDLDEVEDDPDKPKPVSVMEVLKFNSPEKVHIFFACVGSFIMGAAMPLFAVLFGDIIGVLAQAKEDEDYVIRKTNFYSLMFLIVGIVVGVATFIQQYMFSIAGENLTMRMRDQMFRAMVNQEMAWFDDEKRGTGTLCAKLSKEAASVQGATGQRIGTILQSLSTIAIAVSLSMYYSWQLGLVALAFTPFLLIATYMQRGIMQKESEENQKGLEQATKIAVEAVGNIRTVVSLGRESAFHDSYMFELSTSVVRAKRNVHLRAFIFACARSLMFFAYAACMYYGGHLAADGSIEFNEVFKVSQSLIMGTVSIANALAFAPNFQKGLIAAARIIQLLNRKPKVRDPPGVRDIDWTAEGAVDYRGLYFAYPSRPDTRVLRGLNLAIQKGKTIALVGPSGCGKSTTIQLLERFYDPFVGQITIDNNVDIHRDITLRTLRSQMGIVSQEPSLFDRTIEENIAYGDNTRFVTKEEVIEAAKNANIHNFIVNLPLGYDTRLGDKGTQLSGGQKQRVAIARALVRNPRILLLDEATSALDTESEQIVQDALDKAMLGRTCITIAHRLLTIQDADLICVFNRGRISEMGTHQELLQLKGLYHKLYTLQSKQR